MSTPKEDSLLPTLQAHPESLFRLAVDALPSGVAIVAPDGAVALVNRELERQFGYSRDDVVGVSIDVLVPGASRAVSAAVADTDPVDEPRAAARQPWTARHRDGSELAIDLNVIPLDTNEGRFVLASVIDVTERQPSTKESAAILQKQLEIERVVAQLSYRFINLAPEQVIEAIRESLGHVGEMLGVDRCAFWRIRSEGASLVAINWQRQGIAPPPPLHDPQDEFPWTLATLAHGLLVSFSNPGEVPNPADRAGYAARSVKSAVLVPLSVGGRPVGAIMFNMIQERAWTEDLLNAMRMIANVFSGIVARADADEALQQAVSDVERLRDQLDAENLYLRREIEEHIGTGPIIGQTPEVKQVLEQLRQVAATDSTVLLLGETGTGKELFATYLHSLTSRRDRLMVRVNCSAIPTTLIESELFGREKGAFTGALARQIGRFELADNSTIFLDEIGELPAEVQVKLLRVLEQRQIERLGSPRSVHVNVRVIAATHRNLEQRIAEGGFREDLFYRLNVFPVHVPPLRERVDDIPLLIWRFVTEFSKTFGKRVEAISRENMIALQQYTWPGNIRELRNVVERAMIMSTTPRLKIPVPMASATPGKRSLKLVEVEKEHMLNVLKSAGWRIRGVGGAADQLGLKPTTLETRMAKIGISRPRPA